MPSGPRFPTPWPFIFVFLALIGCDDSTAVEHIERAKAYKEKGEIQASIIEFKNALQKDRNDPTARLLLGETYIEAGQVQNAEKELRWARKLGADPKRVMEGLAATWLRQGKYLTILEELQDIESFDADYRKIALRLRAVAQYSLGNPTEAAEEFKRLLEIDAGDLTALVGLTSLALERQDMEAAEHWLSAAQALEAEAPRVLALTGNLRMRQGKLEDARKVYRTVLQHWPKNLGTRLALAQVEYAADDLDAAIEVIGPVLERVPRHSGANYLRALIAMKREDYVVAKYHSERVLQAKPSHAGSLLIAGASSYGLNRLEQAHRYLSTFLGQSPGHEVATKLLAVTQAKLDRRKRHARVLTPLLDDSIDDRSLLAVQDPKVERHRLMVAAGEVWRHFDGSEKPRERDANCEALSERIRSEVARSANSAGVPWIADLTDDRCAEQITADLEQALEEGQQADAAKLLLAQLQLRDGRIETAGSGLSDLPASEPERPGTLLLKALAELGGEHYAKAKSSLRGLDEIAGGSQATSYLLAWAYRQPEDATRLQERLERVLEIEPGHRGAKLDLARLAGQQGQLDRAKLLIGELLAVAPVDADVRELAGTLALGQGDYREALTHLEAALAAGPNSTRVLKLALALDRAGREAEAISALLGWLGDHPRDVTVRLALANRHLAAKRFAAARNEYRKILLIAPDDLVALNNLAWVELRLGNSEAALEPAELAHELAPDNASVLDTFGLAAMEAGDLDKAVTLLRRAVKRAPGEPRSQHNLARALALQGDKDEARRILEEMLSRHGDFADRGAAQALLNRLED